MLYHLNNRYFYMLTTNLCHFHWNLSTLPVFSNPLQQSFTCSLLKIHLSNKTNETNMFVVFLLFFFCCFFLLLLFFFVFFFCFLLLLFFLFVFFPIYIIIGLQYLYICWKCLFLFKSAVWEKRALKCPGTTLKTAWFDHAYGRVLWIKHTGR